MPKTLIYAIVAMTINGTLIGVTFYKLGESHGYAAGVASIAPLAGLR